MVLTEVHAHGALLLLQRSELATRLLNLHQSITTHSVSYWNQELQRNKEELQTHDLRDFTLVLPAAGELGGEFQVRPQKVMVEIAQAAQLIEERLRLRKDRVIAAYDRSEPWHRRA